MLRTLFFPGLLLSLLCGAGSGCQVLEPRPILPAWKSEACGELANALNAVHWQPRVDWSPTREWETREMNRPAAHSLRWRYASSGWRDALAEWEDRLALRPELSPLDFDEEELLATLAKSDNLTGWNAAILLAQQNPERAKAFAPVLAKLATHPPRYLVPQAEISNARPEPDSIAGQLAELFKQPVAGPVAESKQISLAMQAAAAEAWCLVLGSETGDPIAALAPAGRALLDHDLPDEVRGELFRGIGRRVPPANVPGLDQALPARRGQRPNASSLRQAALEACVLYALWNRDLLADPENLAPEANPWPSTLLDWQWEPDAYFESDPAMRRGFAYWLVLTRHPNAGKVLESHLTDQEFSVRDDALVHLGWLKTSEALEILQKHARRPEPRVRAMAAKGLAHWGVSYLGPFLDDESHEVRLSVAEELGRFPTHEAAMRLKDLQADASGDVEQTALESTRYWPDPLAIPVLLHGMEHASVQTRRECFRELRRRTQIKDSFPVTAGPEVRQAAVRELAQKWNLPAHLDLQQNPRPVNAKVNRLRVEELRLYLDDVTNPEFPENSARHQLALQALKESAPEDVPAMETFVLEQQANPQTEVILREVLPFLSPVHGALRKMQSKDVQERRNAMNVLRQIAERQTLSRLALRLLRNALRAETDGLVWRSALYAIFPDDNPETALLVAKAANHPESGIRQMACQFAARHKRPAFADWLLPLIHDSQQAVQLAAIEAAGLCGNRMVIEGVPAPNPKESLPGLRALLTAPDSRVSLAAAIAMSHLGDPQGHDELLRLSRHPDHRIRLQVIAAMGISRQTRFVEALIGMGWTARNDQVKREVLKSLDGLVPAEKRPPALAKARGTEDKIKVWAEWWDQNQNRGTF